MSKIEQFVVDCKNIYKLVWERFEKWHHECVQSGEHLMPQHPSFANSTFLWLFSKCHSFLLNHLRDQPYYFIHYVRSKEFVNGYDLFLDIPISEMDRITKFNENELLAQIRLVVQQEWTHNFNQFEISLYEPKTLSERLAHKLDKLWTPTDRTTFKILNFYPNFIVHNSLSTFYQFVQYVFPANVVRHKHLDKINYQSKWFIQTKYLPELFDMFPSLINYELVAQLKTDFAEQLFPFLPVPDLVHICLEFCFM